jgi:hypothetical protein
MGRQHLLLENPDLDHGIKPFTDPKLARSKSTYARFVGALLDSGLIGLGPAAIATVGLFLCANLAGDRG